MSLDENTVAIQSAIVGKRVIVNFLWNDVDSGYDRRYLMRDIESDVEQEDITEKLDIKDKISKDKARDLWRWLVKHKFKGLQS